MKVKECMCDKVCYCTPETTINNVAKLMNDNHVGCIPVCDTNNCVVGILTDRDIILRTVACGKDYNNTTASEIMTTQTQCCESEDDVDNVTQNMSQNGIRRIPVTQNR